METIVFENGKLVQDNKKLQFAGIYYVEPMLGYEHLASSLHVSGKTTKQIQHVIKRSRNLRKGKSPYRKYEVKK